MSVKLAKGPGLRRLDLLAAHWRKVSQTYATPTEKAIIYAELAGELETVVEKIRNERRF